MAIARINFVGCGKLGKIIAYLINKSQCGLITAILTSTLNSTHKAIKFIGQGKACSNFDELPFADMYFITTPDDKITSSCESLIRSKNFNTQSTIVHCSGSLSSDILIAAKNVGCGVASIHPVKSFANPKADVSNFTGTYCAIEGDEVTVPGIKKLFENIGAQVFNINKDNKYLYHVASVIANNYLVTLHSNAVACYKASGVNDDIAKNLASMLMNDALQNLNQFNHEKSLTGPIQRGDLETIKNHLQALNDKPALKKIYSILGQATLALTNHSETKKEELQNILN